MAGDDRAPTTRFLAQQMGKNGPSPVGAASTCQ